jgi:NAD(P)H dehydrogenase (quinone)
LRLKIALLVLLLAIVTAADTRVLIVYDSVDGHTEKVANWIAQGVKEQPDTSLRLLRVEQATHEDLIWADAILVGSPVYNAGLTPKIGTFMAEWPFDDNPLKNRVGGAFVSSKGATAGAENAIFSILKTMMIFRLLVVGGEDWRSGFGVAYVLDGSSEQTLGFTEAQSKNLAARACQLARCTMEMRAR